MARRSPEGQAARKAETRARLAARYAKDRRERAEKKKRDRLARQAPVIAKVKRLTRRGVKPAQIERITGVKPNQVRRINKGGTLSDKSFRAATIRLRPWAIITSDGSRREVTPMIGDDTNKIKTWRNGVQKAVGGDFSGLGSIPSRDLRIDTVEGIFHLNNNGPQLEALYDDDPDLFEDIIYIRDMAA